MPAALLTMIQTVRNFWTRFMRFLDARAEHQVAAWAAQLQYRRRYTNPEDAKAYRRTLEERQ